MNFFLSLIDVFRFSFYKIKNQLLFQLRFKLKNTKRAANNTNRDILEEIRVKGYSISENFFSKSECNFFIELIENFILKNSKEVSLFHDFDHRIYGAEIIHEKINFFLNNTNIINLFSVYTSTGDLRRSMTLAQKTIYKKDNPGSGLGWHVDHTIIKYPKAMVYLCDVTQKNGAFQYIEKTHKFYEKVKIRLKNNLEFSKNFFTNQEVEGLVNKNNYICKTIEAKAGTVIYFDGNGIHRGSPLEMGSRYSLTNYYYFGVPGGDNFPLIKSN